MILHTTRSTILFNKRVEVICCGHDAELKLLKCKLVKKLAQTKILSVKDSKLPIDS